MEIICSICCCGFLEKQEALPFTRSPKGSNTVYASYCGHIFHKPCIMKWIEKSRSCPECRAELRNRSDFNKLFFNVNPKWNNEQEEFEQSSQPCEADEEKIVMQKRTEKLTRYIKCVTKELGHVELKFDKLKQEIAKKDQEIAELKNLLNMERLLVPMKRQSLK